MLFENFYHPAGVCILIFVCGNSCEKLVFGVDSCSLLYFVKISCKKWKKWEASLSLQKITIELCHTYFDSIPPPGGMPSKLLLFNVWIICAKFTFSGFCEFSENIQFKMVVGLHKIGNLLYGLQKKVNVKWTYLMLSSFVWEFDWIFKVVHSSKQFKSKQQSK